MIKLFDKMFDGFLYWLERVQWERDDRRWARKRKKDSKEKARIRKNIDNAKKVLKDNGYVFERDWQDIKYQDKIYTPTMIEEISDETIIIHAKKAF